MIGKVIRTIIKVKKEDNGCFFDMAVPTIVISCLGLTLLKIKLVLNVSNGHYVVVSSRIFGFIPLSIFNDDVISYEVIDSLEY